MADSTDLLQA